MLLHVIDAASPDVANQRDTVYRVLRELGVTDSQLRSRVIEVWNKADLLEKPTAPRVPSSVPNDESAGHAAKAPSLEDSDECDDGGAEPSFEAEGLSNVALGSPLSMGPSNGREENGPSKLSADVQRSALAQIEATADVSGLSTPLAEAAQQGSAAGTKAKDALCAAAVSTSTLSGDGLDELLHLLDRKLAVKLGTQELAGHTAFLGPRLLSRSLFGPDRANRRTVARSAGVDA